MAKRTRAKARPRERLEVEARRAQMIAVGLAAFSERSYEDVAIEALARTAGVSKGLWYHYFPTKRDLYLAALEEAARQLLEETRPDAAASPEESLRAGLEAYLRFVRRRAKAYVALMRGGIGSDPAVFAILERTREELVRRIAENLPEERLVPLLRTGLRGWIGFVEAAALDWLRRRKVEEAEVVALCLQTLLGVIQGTLIEAVPSPEPQAAQRGRGSRRARPSSIP